MPTQRLFAVSKRMHVCYKQPSIFSHMAIGSTSLSMQFHPGPSLTGNSFTSTGYCSRTVDNDLECMHLITCAKPVRTWPHSNPSFFNWHKMPVIRNSSKFNSWSKHQRPIRVWLRGVKRRPLLCKRNLSFFTHLSNKTVHSVDSRINTLTRTAYLERCSDIFNMGWYRWRVWALDSVFSVWKLRKSEVFSHHTAWTYGMRWSMQRVLFRDHEYDGEKRREDID